MKTKTLIAITAALTALTVQAKPVSTEPVDFNNLNPILKAIADASVMGDERVEWIYPYFDPARSSLANEKLYYSTNGSVRNTPWPQSGKLTVAAEVSYEVDRVSTLTGISVKLKKTTTLDFLSMTRYGCDQALKRIGVYTDVDEVRAKDLLKRCTAVQGLVVLKSLILEGKLLALDFAENEQKKWQDYLICLHKYECGNVTIDQWGNRLPDYVLINSTKNKIEQYISLVGSIKLTKIEGDAAQIKITNPVPGGLIAVDRNYREPVDLAGAEVVLKIDSFSVSGEVFLNRSISELNTLKKDLTKDLVDIQNNTNGVRARTQSDFKRGLEEIRKWIDQTK